MMKLYSAISPSMNDQWSGKTLRMMVFAGLAMPIRSSAQSATPPATLAAGLGVLVRRAHPRSQKLGPTGSSKSRCATRYPSASTVIAQLRQRSVGRAEDHLAVVGHVERRLVAGAEQVVRLLLVQADRAADVGADLGVGHDALVAPVRAPACP